MDIKTILWYMILLCVINISMQTCTVKQTSGVYYSSSYYRATVLECQNLSTDIPIVGLYGSQIKKIKIQNSRFTSLKANAFQSAQSVDEITISGSALKIIEPSGFNNLPALKQLLLANNNISTITKGVFNHLTNLRTLDLSNNIIEHIEDQSLLGTKIQSLYLEHNKIEDMSPIVENCKTMTTLNLNFNSIKKIYSLSDCTSLNILNISDNSIVHLQNMLFPRSLMILNLRNNQIESIEPETFLQLTKLHTLDLSNNNLYKVSNGRISLGLFQPLTEVKYLNISFNELSELLPGTFTQLTSLTSLDLGYNNLTHLSTGLLSHTPLTFLSIRSNQFTDLENNFFNHKHRITIDIDDNQWNCDYLSQKIHQIISVNPLNKVINGYSTNAPNINGIKCNHNKSMERNITIYPPSYQSNADLLLKLVYSIEDLEADQEETNNLLVDIIDLLRNLTLSRSHDQQQLPNTDNTTENKSSNSNLYGYIYNMTMAIAENTNQLQRVSKPDEGTAQVGRSFASSIEKFQENITGPEALSGNQTHSELSQIRVLLLMILLAIIAFILLISAIFVFAVFKSKRNDQIRVPQDTLLDTY